MNNNEIIQNICGGLFGTALYVGFLLMFIWAAWRGDFIFHYGRIRGKLARVIGVIGLIGMAAGTYLMASLFIFDTIPPFAAVAGFLLGLLFVMLFVIRFLALFMWHEK
jgi:hypothetical protein